MIKTIRKTLAESGDREPVVHGRYELKLTAPRCELARVRAWLRTHPAVFVAHHPPRRVNSIYFDTPDLSCFRENLAGLTTRTKLRLRWYGEDLAAVLGTLEAKRKQGLVGWKEHRSLSKPLRLDVGTWPEIVSAIRREVEGLWVERLGIAGCPVIITSYRREYHRTIDGKVRATLDHDLTAYDQRRFLRPNLRARVPLGDKVILELKCDRAEHDYLRGVVPAFPVRVEKCSKYVQGIEAAGP